MNDMRASRTRKLLEADTVDVVEGKSDASVPAWAFRSSGVCVVGMLETVQPRNLGDPAVSPLGVGHTETVCKGWSKSGGKSDGPIVPWK